MSQSRPLVHQWVACRHTPYITYQFRENRSIIFFRWLFFEIMNQTRKGAYFGRAKMSQCWGMSTALIRCVLSWKKQTTDSDTFVYKDSFSSRNAQKSRDQLTSHSNSHEVKEVKINVQKCVEKQETLILKKTTHATMQTDNFKRDRGILVTK